MSKVIGITTRETSKHPDVEQKQPDGSSDKS